MADDVKLKSREKDVARAYHVIPRSWRRKARKAWLDIKHVSAKDNSLPDFYIIGTMKSGTTALYMHLETHPDILPAHHKEVHYFNTHRDLGERYFRSNFPPASACEPRENSWGRQIVGEATPDYVFHPASAKLCQKITPNARFIMLMRNPIDRAFSHWKQGRRFEFEDQDFDRAVALEERRLAGEADKLERDIHYYSYRHQMYSYLARGRYAEQIERWLTYFRREQMLFINSDDMFKNGLDVYGRVTDFLGISDWKPKEFSLVFKGLEGDMAPETRSSLREYFEPHNQRLYALMGEDYGWR